MDLFRERVVTTRLRGDCMAVWLDLLEDATSLRSLYGNYTPSLEPVHLHEISLHRDGARVNLRFDLEEYPKDPPKKWRILGFNTVQVQLALIGIRELSLRGWSSRMDAKMSLSREVDCLRVIMSTSFMAIDIKAEWAMMVKVSAYLSNETEPHRVT